MSATPDIQQDLVTIEINGTPYQARKGQMIIQVADEAGIVIPRFCYHKKMPIAANCRMCLVDVEKAPKPLPACATPVTDGMKVFTRSERAIAAQKAVMEFLLINHPLDCPICDQGGECELQDLALGYGRSVSRFAEKKRVVADHNLGPLISTDMTRCIHCTRCVRFLEVIAGQKELGGLGRGEHMRIDTYIERSIQSEMSGNIIDVCPVGALTSKPFRYTARAWELRQVSSIAPHDSIGSNLSLHVRRGRVMRVIPRENEAINEVWISDRDRFGYQGLYAPDRLEGPMLRRAGQWQRVDWQTALEHVRDRLTTVIREHGAEQIGALAAPMATLEELYLLNRLMRGLGCPNLDHRLRQADFRDQDAAVAFPSLGQAVADLERLDTALLVGSNVRHDQPIAAHRLRKAALRGARIMVVNPLDFDFHFPLAEKIVTDPAGMVRALAAIARAASEAAGAEPPPAVRGILAQARPDSGQQQIARALLGAPRAAVLLGNLATAHPDLAELRGLARVIAETAGAVLGHLPEAANSVGAWVAGVLPHRDAAGSPVQSQGMDVAQMLGSPRKALVLLHAEPEYDFGDAARAAAAVAAADFRVVLTPYAGAAVKEYADVLLPVAPFSETPGTFVNAEGRWQSFAAAGAPLGDCRPAWKVLRVLGNLFGLPGFEYVSAEEVRDELRAHTDGVEPRHRGGWAERLRLPESGTDLVRIGDVPIYNVDAITRRASALQQTAHARAAEIRICAALADRLGLSDAPQAVVVQDGGRAMLPLAIDERVPDRCVWVSAALPGTVTLGPAIGPVKLERA